ncbi:MAG: hypothetical protein V1922_01970 [bacterium]
MKKVNLYNLKRDRYSHTRGGYSRFINVYCGTCKNFVLLYQKDGPGSLKRLYMDRIFAPENLVNLQKNDSKKTLICENCKNIIGFPIVYEKERRRAFHLKQGSFIKKITTGNSYQEVDKPC